MGASGAGSWRVAGFCGNADTALRLARFFGTTVDFWMNLQSQYGADMARLALGEALESIKPCAAVA